MTVERGPDGRCYLGDDCFPGHCAWQLDDKIAELRALVAELAEACDWHESGNFCQSHNDGSCNCGHRGELIARARKAVE